MSAFGLSLDPNILATVPAGYVHCTSSSFRSPRLAGHFRPPALTVMAPFSTMPGKWVQTAYKEQRSQPRTGPWVVAHGLVRRLVPEPDSLVHLSVSAGHIPAWANWDRCHIPRPAGLGREILSNRHQTAHWPPRAGVANRHSQQPGG